MAEQEGFLEEDEVVYEAEIPILTVTPGDKEKTNVFRSLLTMRNEASFCDVSFLVQGTLFRAHRVVVSSWSHWLFALLSEGPDQEIVSLDVFSPHEFGSILDYMYGEPLEFTLANAEYMMKIIRRLELRDLEQKCWRFLLSIVNKENCAQLHQIADFFECAPLKISAWRLIQESKPGYGSAPDHMANSMEINSINARLRGHGLTGPGEMDVLSSQNIHDDDDSDDDEGEFSIFSGTTPTGFSGGHGSVVPDEGLLGSINKRYDHYVHPNKLPKGTPAAQVVKAWAFRLHEVFIECHGGNGLTIAEHAGMSADASNNSENESGQQEVQHQISTFSIVSDGLTTGQMVGNVTPILPQSLPKRKTPEDKKASVKFSNLKENVENVDNNSAQKEVRKEDSYKFKDADVDWKEELSKFYVANNLEDKLQSIDAILEAWHGRELDMMEVLHDKYDVEFDDELRKRLSQS